MPPLTLTLQRRRTHAEDCASWQPPHGGRSSATPCYVVDADDGGVIFRILFVGAPELSRENPGARGGPGACRGCLLAPSSVAGPAPEALSFENHGGRQPLKDIHGHLRRQDPFDDPL